MELRVLKYFLAVAREQSISGAAETLHLSQPTLSRQLKEMEDELGKQLLIRGNRRVTLTEEGMILRKRAEEILELVKKAEDEISMSEDVTAGDITIGAGETDGVRFLIKAARSLQKNYPLIHFHIVSGDGVSVLEDLDRGLIDFGLIFGGVDASKYEYIDLPYRDVWGVFMRRDSPLAEKKFITAEDLIDKPLIFSRQAFQKKEFRDFFPCPLEKLNIAATYNLPFNGSLMVEEGIGYAICFDKIINVSGDSKLCFRPLKPQFEASMSIVWKKYRVISKAAGKFLEKLKETI
ncbi:MAG: LysR family transcriptional regulator [Ruminococcus sp.]|nr:LysR family transcriptional regulator [Ruminococcus sp.]MCM1382522.1 LysR family transcriptional regulator [Muribaculaceae bacterium]MCM1480255.1 LysR family transcriptional regulator [Muribaculaceae bacterium]